MEWRVIEKNDEKDNEKILTAVLLIRLMIADEDPTLPPPLWIAKKKKIFVESIQKIKPEIKEELGNEPERFLQCLKNNEAYKPNPMSREEWEIIDLMIGCCTLRNEL